MAYTPYSVTMARGVRNLILGRVLLKANSAAASMDIDVGIEQADLFALMDIPGTYFFYNNVTSCVVVEPTAADVQEGIEYSETVDISSLSRGATNLPAPGGLINSYTTARGAYACLVDDDLPAYVGGLRVLEEDCTDLGLTEPDDHWFPAIYVSELDTQRTSHTNLTWIDSTRIVVRYY